MYILINIAGTSLIAVSLMMFMHPTRFSQGINKIAAKRITQSVAIVIRLFLGILLIAYANQSAFPLALKTIGWIAVIAAMILAVMPNREFKKLVMWVMQKFSAYIRQMSFVVFLFGAFLIYAVA